MKKAVKWSGIICLLITFLAVSCTFDYGETDPSERMMPDLVMENVEYVRVRSSDPIAKFHAERAERYERQGIMRLEVFSFEQYGDRGEETNVYGSAGYASVDIRSGDIFMDRGVRLEVDSEDIIIETNQLEWKDEQRILSSGEENEVNIYQQNGTSFTGIGFSVDARRRMWEFSGQVSGSYVHEDDDE